MNFVWQRFRMTVLPYLALALINGSIAASGYPTLGMISAVFSGAALGVYVAKRIP